jgi:hypothetical protein
MQQTHAAVKLTRDMGIDRVQELSNIATIFQIFNNPDAKARDKIEKAMKEWYVWATYPEAQMQVCEKNHVSGLNTLVIDRKNTEMIFSETALYAIMNGLPIALELVRDIKNDKLRILGDIPEWSIWAPAAVVISEDEQMQVSALADLQRE